MKDFKHTGRGPKLGHSFSSKAGYTGSTGRVQNVRGYTRGVPVCKAEGGWIKGAIKHPGALHRQLGVPQGQKIPTGKLEKAAHSSNPTLRKRAQLAETLKGFATGGVVKVADPGSSVVRRTKPVTEFDAQHGGKGPLRSGFAEGGKVGGIGDAIRMVRQLMAQGNSAEAAASKAARRYGVPAQKLKTNPAPTGGGALPAEKQMLARGGLGKSIQRVANRVANVAIPAARGAPVQRPAAEIPRKYGNFGRRPLVG